MLILLVSCSSFSQTVTENDTVKLSSKVAKLVIKDLISGDACEKHLEIANKVIVNQEQQLSLYQGVVVNMGKENAKLEDIIDEKETQLSIKDEQVKNAEKALKRQKRTTTFYKITSAAALITAGVLLIK